MIQHLPTHRQPIAVVGVGALFPGSTDATGFWRDILAGRDLIRDVPESHWLIDDYYDPDPAAVDKTYAKRGAFLDAIDFDALGWGVPPSTIPATDTSQLLALVVAQTVLQDAAREQFDTIDRSRMSVILGVTSAQDLLSTMVSRLQRPVWVKALRESGLPEDEVQAACDRIAAHYVPWQEATFPGLLGNVVAGRIANRMNLGGTNCVTDAACASTFSALSMAINELHLGHSDLVISGGVDTLNDIFMYMCFSKTPALSPSGDCRPFSDQADGTMLGEGVGMVALKRLADAERDGDRIYAVIKGLGTSSDGRSKSVYAPVPAGQAQALRRAYEIAGYGADTVELMEAHGTGTKAGDAAEFEGLRTVFDEADAERRQWCALGSVKSQIGHTKAAAGAAGLFKAIMALHHKVLPPTIKVAQPNPKLELERSPFYLNTTTRPWIRNSDHPRRASVSAFGFGGSNFHIALEEYAGTAQRAERLASQSHELVLVGGADPGDLLRRAQAMLDASDPLAVIADRSRRDWRHDHAARLAVVVRDRGELDARVRAALQRIAQQPQAAFALADGTAYGVGAVPGKIALLFPGQGSQYLQMGADVAVHHPAAREVWDQAADLAFEHATALHDVVFPPARFDAEQTRADNARLTTTQWAQPAIGATSLSLLALLETVGVQAAMVGGHSFGEVVAMHAAGAVDALDLLRIARRRGEAMAAAAAAPGAMLALSMPIDQVRGLIARFAPELVVANHNAPQQVVVSGTLAAIEAFERGLGSKQIAGTRLPVATAFHSEIVASACAPFGEFLQSVPFRAPRMPVFANASAAPYAPDPAALRDGLAAQIASQVRFVEMIETMHARGARIFVEVGPSSVLTGLVGAILGERAHAAIATDRRGKPGDEMLMIAIARLAALGVPVTPAALHADRRAPQAPLPIKLSVPINGNNHGKLYPPPGGSAALPPPNPPRAAAVPVIASVEESVPTNHAAATPSPAPIEPAAPLQTVKVDIAAPAAVDAQWLAAFQQLQQQTAETHAAFQRSMFDSHAAYLQVAEAALQGLGALTGGVATPIAPVARMERSAIREPAAEAGTQNAQRGTELGMDVVPPQAAVVGTHPGSGPGQALGAAATGEIVALAGAEAGTGNGERGTGLGTAAMPPLAGAHPGAYSPSTTTDSNPRQAPGATAIDIQALMLSVVAEKTGYPTDMLDLGMDLEGDLGIDSIKRVEILAAVSERAPQMPKVDRAHMSALHTLGEIVEYLQRLGGAEAGTGSGEQGTELGRAVMPPPAVAGSGPGQVPGATAIDIQALMLSVVAEKTGYPTDMLDLGMDLEGDLGIDSIKRVEILAAVSERAPQMPKVDRAHLAGLHTLGEIVAYLQRLAGAEAGTGNGERGTGLGTAVMAPLAAVRQVPGAIAIDIQALMLSVVAEKTGYPSDMLDPGMDLEGDLGIDSIKRVEILAAVSERGPQMPKVDRAHMSALHTLGEIVEYLQRLAGAEAGTRNGERGTGTHVVAASVVVPAQPEIQQRPDVAAESPSALGRYALRRIAAPATGLGLPGLRDLPVHVTGGSAVDAALVAELVARGIDARSVPVVPPDAVACIHTGGLRDVADADAAIAINRDAFAAARVVANAIGEHEGLFVTVQDTGGMFESDDPVRAWLTGMPALVKTAALEWPRAAVKAIDLQRHARNPATLARVLADELLAGGGEIEVGLTADGERHAWTSVPVGIERTDAVIGADDVVIVTGGARGVTAGCIVEWARDCRAKFVLLGRTALQDEPVHCSGIDDAHGLKRALLQAARDAGRQPTPNELQHEVDRVLGNREIRRTAAAIAAAGGQARYAAVDVTDAQALDALLADVRMQWGAITAVVHAAGVLADRRIADKTDAQFERVFATKVGGLRALLRATARDPLKLLCAFSSVSARCGNTGQADYAMANEVLNKVVRAETQRRTGLRGRSLGWGPWEGGMVTPALRDRFAALGVPMIPLQVGARMFADEMRSADADVEWVLGGAPRQDVLLSAGADRRVQALDVHVSRATHGWLAGHAVGAVPVVPVVLAAEWMTRAVRSFRPGSTVAALHDVRVLKGIRLTGFDGAGDRYRIEVVTHVEHADQLQVTIIDTDGRPRYSARAETGAAPRAPEAGLPTLALDAWHGAPLYGDLLFHRGSFELIAQVDGISDHGVGATLRGVDHAGWRHEPWHLDVAALDGGLQMAVLYGQRMLGGPSLPTSVEEIRCYSPAPAKGLITAAAYRRGVGDAAVTTDILFTDQHGVRIAELRGVQNHRLPQAH